MILCDTSWLAANKPARCIGDDLIWWKTYVVHPTYLAMAVWQDRHKHHHLSPYVAARPCLIAAQMDRMQEKQLKAQRELFVGNLAPGAVSEASLYQVFHSALIAAFPQAAQPGQEPVLKVCVCGFLY